MDDNEWSEFRNAKWLAYKTEIGKHTLPPPDWYMQSREEYVEFLKTKDISKITTPKTPSGDFKKLVRALEADDAMNLRWTVEGFSKENWENYRKEKWLQAIEEHKDSLIKKLGNDPDPEQIPYWFLKDQMKYAAAIQKYENLKNEVTAMESEILTKKWDLVDFVVIRAEKEMIKINNEIFGFDSPSLRKSEKAELKTDIFKEDQAIKKFLKQK